MFTKITIPLIISILLGIFIILFHKGYSVKWSEPNENIPNQMLEMLATSTQNINTSTPKLKGDAIEEKFFQNVVKYPREYQTTTINQTRYIVLGFDVYDVPQGNDGGIRLYKRTDSGYEFVWESSEMITQVSSGRVHFKDLNNDAIPEIVALDGPNGSGSYVTLFIYQLQNDEIKTIIPFRERKWPDDYIIGKDIFFADLESDTIPEIVVDRGPDPNIPEKERYIQTEDGFSLREGIIVFDVYTYTNGTYELTRTSVKEEEIKKLLENVDREYII